MSVVKYYNDGYIKYTHVDETPRIFLDGHKNMDLSLVNHKTLEELDVSKYGNRITVSTNDRKNAICRIYPSTIDKTNKIVKEFYDGGGQISSYIVLGNKNNPILEAHEYRESIQTQKGYKTAVYGKNKPKDVLTNLKDAYKRML